ncbi:hypothetical protein [Anaerophaga thermohalophila]|jgi:hypothetical protein|uniref:hypothetical protein n=1 Tax=Anaerophaga thermohalophila TaxID=177400 RepID=UPI000237D55F|nr:hypothetical protein [Anaerophaga thermohalophila]
MKKNRNITKRTGSIVAFSILFILAVLLTGRQQPVPQVADKTSVAAERPKKDVEYCTEADSGEERSNHAASYFMIGLPF